MKQSSNIAAALFLAAAAALTTPARAAAPDLEAAVRALGATETEAVEAAIAELGRRADPAALPALEALADGQLRIAGDGAVFIARGKGLTDALTGKSAAPAGALREAESNNQIRRALRPVLARLRLGAPDPAVRLAAAQELAGGDDEARPLIERALAAEANGQVKEVLSLALARLDLRHGDPERRASAASAIASVGKGAARADLEALLRDEKHPRVREAAEAGLGKLRTREALTSGVGHVMHGLSLASVFLFAALGLAITFGVMGVINMAHGEMLTIGAYTTFVVQVLFRTYLPSVADFYLLAAIPAAFLVATAAGIALERGVIRWLYGRPLETLLATWGLSLIVIQTIRLIFGAANVTVATPSWLSGGAEIASGLVLPWSRIGVVVFVIATALFVWFFIRRTGLGLQVRAVTQNRAMAACMGVRTSRVDMWTFGLGSGVAGLGGVALSQIGNVGPELGQSYIIDSFMVVVLGGVGRIAGTLGAAVGLGMTSKFLEPVAGAVLGKIAVLAMIILFIQWRPQGLFPVKGRVEA